MDNSLIIFELQKPIQFKLSSGIGPGVLTLKHNVEIEAFSIYIHLKQQEMEMMKLVD